MNDLEEAKENLKDNNGILEEERELKAREAHIAEQDRLYNVIRRDTQKQICLMDEMIEQIEKADTDEMKKHILKKMLVIGAYLKRRSNLVFLSDKDSMLDARELELSIEESMNNLETFGITCGFISESEGPVLSTQIISVYDFFEEITERSLDCMNSLMVRAQEKSNSDFLMIYTDSHADFSDLASDTAEAVRDEDGEWKLTLRLNKGGDGQ